jgi:hypothetical protein
MKIKCDYTLHSGTVVNNFTANVENMKDFHEYMRQGFIVNGDIKSFTILEIDGTKINHPVEENVLAVQKQKESLLKNAKIGDKWKTRNGIVPM